MISGQSLWSILKLYKVFLILALINAVLAMLLPDLGAKSLSSAWSNAKEMLSVIPPIFILIGLMDVWIRKETMVRYMGEGSGWRGILLAFFIGSVAAGPLYAAFPVAAILLKKGSKLSNVFIMVGAWSTTKIPLILFELSAMGVPFTLIRFALNLFGIAAIAAVTEWVLDSREKASIYANAQTLEGTPGASTEKPPDPVGVGAQEIT